MTSRNSDNCNAGCKISIIIPIYNHEKYIVECLSSIVYQGYGCYEIIAIDDGSCDDSYSLAREFLERYLNPADWIIISRPNKGINSTLNEGIALARGDVIYLLASDDRLPNKALLQVSDIYSRDCGAGGLYFFDSSLIDSEGKLIEVSAARSRGLDPWLLENSEIYLLTQIILNWGIPFNHQFFSRNFFIEIGPYPECLEFEDMYLALTALNLGKVRFVSQIMKEYRVRDGGVVTPGLTVANIKAGISKTSSMVGQPSRNIYSFLMKVSGFVSGDRYKKVKWLVKLLILRGIQLFAYIMVVVGFSSGKIND